MASASRDRVTIDLRSIGDAVRAAAAGQGITVSQLARRALVACVDGGGAAVHGPGSDGQTPDRSGAKLMLRMARAHADALILNAADLGLSYGEYVARLVEGSKLPQPLREREADRAALLASNDQLAALSADLNALVRMLRQGSSEQAQKYRERLEVELIFKEVSIRNDKSALAKGKSALAVGGTPFEAAERAKRADRVPPKLPPSDRD